MANPLDRFSGKRGSVDVKIRPMPKVADYYRRGGSPEWAAQFDAAMEIWRQDLQRILPSDQTINNTVTTIIQTVLQSSGSPGGGSGGSSSPPFDSSGLIAQIDALSASLAAHIAQVIVHGTTSPVVGTLDEQSLERKTIGNNFPRNGKFQHSIQRNYVDSMEEFTIPLEFNMVVAGPFTVNVGGTLIIDGTLLVL